MAQILRQSTQVKVVIGPVVAVGDGFTPVTTLSVSTADEAEILKHDAAAVTDISGATFAAITSADGYYNLTLTTSHTDTCGMLTVLINDDSLCLPVKQTFMVVEENVYDMLYAASADLGTTVDAILDDTGTSGVLVSSGTGTGQVSLSSGTVTVGTNNDKTGYSLTNLTVQASTTLATGTHTAQTGDGYAYLTTNLGALGANATEAGGTGDHLTAIPWNASWDAEVQSEVQDAIEVNHLDHLLAVTYDPASKPGAADALLNELVENDGGVSRYTANALEQAPTGGSAPSAADIADAVWNEAQADHVTAGTFGIIASEIADILVDTAEIGAAGAGLTNINLPDQTMNITGNITGNLSGSVGSVTGNVGGNVVGSVASVTGGINTAAGTIQTLDALDTAQDTQHSTTQGKVDTAQADLDLLTGTDGATLATSQPNYAPATAAALSTAQGNITDILADTADMQPKLGTPAGASISADIATVDTVVDGIASDNPNTYTKNVAASNFMFPMRNTSDAITTGLTVSGTIIKDNGSSASLTNSIAEVGTTGIYRVDLTQTEMNADEIMLKFTATGAKDLAIKIRTQPT